MKKVKIDPQKCIGCGACTVTAPKSFQLNDQGKAQPIEPAGDQQEEIQEAIDGCPIQAINWQD